MRIMLLFFCFAYIMGMEVSPRRKDVDAMDMDMSIAALSVGVQQGRTQQMLGTSVLKMQLNDMEQELTDILPTVSGSLDPALGASLDILA